MLTHGNKQCPNEISTKIWPYVARMACGAINEAPTIKDPPRKSPTNLFSGLEVNINAKHWKPFGCPAYELDSAISSGRGILQKMEALLSGRNTLIQISAVHSRFIANTEQKDSIIESPFSCEV